MRRANGNATVATSIANSPPPFLSKTYDMVDDPSTDSIVSWGKNGNSFVVWNEALCASDLLPNYFKHKNFSSFVRQLNTYGFRKIESDRWEFANEGFLRGQKHLLKTINRRKPGHVQQSPPQIPIPAQCTSAPPSVEVARPEIEEDIQYLKKDKNVIMQELVTLRHQQQTTDQKLQTVGHRVHLMEQKQQQMMSFLAKAMQSPGFLSQLLHQPNQSDRRISVGNKKRRLPNQEEEILVSKYGSPSPDGRMVNYQPSMNEAAKAMLKQILKMNASTRLEPTINHANGFLISDIPSSSNRISGVTLSEVLTTPVQSHVPVPFGQLTAICEGELSPSSAVEATVTPFQEVNFPSPENHTLPSSFSEIEGIIPESPTEVSDMNFMGPINNSDIEFMDIISGLGDEEIPVLGDDLSSSPDTNVLMDNNPTLPSINDVFWEQFLSASALLGDTDEHSSLVGEVITEEQELHTGPGMGLDGTKNINHLTEQMGLLASETVAV